MKSWLKKITTRSFWTGVFFVMSPYFPGNNWLEIAIIGAFVGLISPFLPEKINLGEVRAGLYIAYNLISVIGLFLLQRDKCRFAFNDFFELAFALLALWLSGYSPEPWGTIMMMVIGIYFLRKTGFFNVCYSRLKERINKS